MEDLKSAYEAMRERAERAEQTIVVLAHELAERRSHVRSAPESDASTQAATTNGVPETITVVEAAKLIGIDRNTLYEMLGRGEGPPARRCGGVRGVYRLDREAVLLWRRGSDGRRTRR